jgi:hypothetical protein
MWSRGAKTQSQSITGGINNMRTIRKKVYKFSELSEPAKQKAIDKYRNDQDGTENQYLYDEAYETVKKFHDIFGTTEGSRSWLQVRTGHLDDNLMNLKGLRLRKYMWNNFGKHLYKGKYFSLWSKTEKSYKHYPEGFPVLKSRHSKVMFEHSCVLTGVCWDESLLQPIYEFLDWKLRPDYYKDLDFDTLMHECICELEKDLENEVEARNGDEFITEEIENAEYEFTQDGRRF